MYWDVVEVKPEPDYSLFVRFQDGLSGRVRLHKLAKPQTAEPFLHQNLFSGN